MKHFSEINWSEGMFMRPHHLQVSTRAHLDLLADEVGRLQPYCWGVIDLEIAESDLENFVLSVRSCKVRMLDGTALSFPGNAELEPRNFREALNRVTGPMDAFIGIPRLKEKDANTKMPGEGVGREDLRYKVRMLEVTDENTGSNPQQVELRSFNARLFFTGENMDGYDLLKIARIERSGVNENVPVLSADYVPPLLDVTAWPPLRNMVSDLIQRMTAISRSLSSAAREPGGTKVRPELDAQQLLRLQTTAGASVYLSQLLSTPHLHPFLLYLELARLAGQLSIFRSADELPAVPTYNHDKVWSTFYGTCELINGLLSEVSAPTFILQRFEREANLLRCNLQPAWTAGEAELYVGVESELERESVDQLMRGVKAAAAGDIPTLNQRRLPGLKLTPMTRVPGDLPARPGLAYYRVETAGEFWDGVVKENTLALSGLRDESLKTDLYVLLRS